MTPPSPRKLHNDDRNQILQNHIFEDIRRERSLQSIKFGAQGPLASVDRVLTERKGGCTGERMCEQYEIPGELRAKYLTHTSFERGQGTWAHVLVEEVSEAISAAAEKGDVAALDAELVQVAAVAVAWLEHLRSGRMG